MIKRLLPAIALLVLCLIATPRPVLAYDFFKGGCNSDATNTVDSSNSVACQSNPQTDANGNSIDPLVGPNGLLAHITNIVTIVAGAAAVIMIIISALKLITSGSDVSTGSRTDTDVEDARRALANAVIGLVVIVAARTIIVYLLSQL